MAAPTKRYPLRLPLFIITPSPPHPRHQLWRATLQQPYHIFKEFSSMASCLNCCFLGSGKNFPLGVKVVIEAIYVSHSQLSLQSPTAKDASLLFQSAAAHSMGVHVVLLQHGHGITCSLTSLAFLGTLWALQTPLPLLSPWRGCMVACATFGHSHASGFHPPIHNFK